MGRKERLILVLTGIALLLVAIFLVRLIGSRRAGQSQKTAVVHTPPAPATKLTAPGSTAKQDVCLWMSVRPDPDDPGRWISFGPDWQETLAGEIAETYKVKVVISSVSSGEGSGPSQDLIASQANQVNARFVVVAVLRTKEVTLDALLARLLKEKVKGQAGIDAEIKPGVSALRAAFQTFTYLRSGGGVERTERDCSVHAFIFDYSAVTLVTEPGSHERWKLNSGLLGGEELFEGEVVKALKTKNLLPRATTEKGG